MHPLTYSRCQLAQSVYEVLRISQEISLPQVLYLPCRPTSKCFSPGCSYRQLHPNRYGISRLSRRCWSMPKPRTPLTTPLPFRPRHAHPLSGDICCVQNSGGTSQASTARSRNMETTNDEKRSGSREPFVNDWLESLCLPQTCNTLSRTRSVGNIPARTVGIY